MCSRRWNRPPFRMSASSSSVSGPLPAVVESLIVGGSGFEGRPRGRQVFQRRLRTEHILTGVSSVLSCVRPVQTSPKQPQSDTALHFSGQGCPALRPVSPRRVAPCARRCALLQNRRFLREIPPWPGGSIPPGSTFLMIRKLLLYAANFGNPRTSALTPKPHRTRLAARCFPIPTPSAAPGAARLSRASLQHDRRFHPAQRWRSACR